MSGLKPNLLRQRFTHRISSLHAQESGLHFRMHGRFGFFQATLLNQSGSPIDRPICADQAGFI
ncbi:MAG: hypothetical protein HEQ39_03100 [Rhizobacter sp.]